MDIKATFLPIGQELINQVFPQSIVYHRSEGTAYDPLTGTVVETVTDYNISAGVLQQSTTEGGGVEQTQELLLYIEHSTTTGMPHEPTTADAVTYQGVKWKVTNIAPFYPHDNGIVSKLSCRVF